LKIRIFLLIFLRILALRLNPSLRFVLQFFFSPLTFAQRISVLQLHRIYDFLPRAKLDRSLIQSPRQVLRLCFCLRLRLLQRQYLLVQPLHLPCLSL
jgi:hypothetical protein